MLYIGNQRVTPIIVDNSGGGAKYFGCSGDTFIGEIDTNGILQAAYNSQYINNIEFTGVKDIGQAGLSAKFNNETSNTPLTSYGRGRSRLVKNISFPDLVNITGKYGLYSFCNGQTTLESISFPKLQIINADNAMSYAFQSCTSLTSIDLSTLTSVSGSSAMANAFIRCTNLASVDLSNLVSISGQNGMGFIFSGCTSLTSIDLSNLTTISGNYALSSACAGCPSLTSIDLSNLEVIGTDTSSTNYGHFENCFNYCNNLTLITFPKLEKIYCTGGASGDYGTFANNNRVQKMYFPKLDTITYGTGASTKNQNACKYVFYGCSALTELHFAAANQAAIEASPGYSTAWGRGAGNVTIYFDL